MSRGVRTFCRRALAHQTGEARWLEEVPGCTPRPVALDLFCGAGGLSQGFQMPDSSLATGLDLEPGSVETHAANFLAKSRVMN